MDIKEYRVLDHGYVKYLDHMGDDSTIAMDARTSYDRRSPGEDRSLLRRLMRDNHTSPFEMGVLKVEMKMPIFVARQIVRHRTASMNEVSARYTQLPEEMFVPENLEYQSKKNKQGRDGRLGERINEWLKTRVRSANSAAYSTYTHLLQADVTREQARGVLPLNVYTKFVWKMDLHNLFHFLQLRLDTHAQYECRIYAEALWGMVQELFPLCAEAFEDYRLYGIKLSVFEHNMIKFLIRSDGPLEERVVTLYKAYVELGNITKSEWENFVTNFQLPFTIEDEGTR